MSALPFQESSPVASQTLGFPVSHPAGPPHALPRLLLPLLSLAVEQFGKWFRQAGALASCPDRSPATDKADGF